MALPTYEEATEGPEALELVAPYLEDQDLLSCALVDHYFSSIFGVELWKNPFRDLNKKRNPCRIVHFFFFDAVDVALDVRSRVRVIDLRPLYRIRQEKSHTQDYQEYGGCEAAPWFLLRLKHFPNLDCVILNAASTQDLGGNPASDTLTRYAQKPRPEFLDLTGCATIDFSMMAGKSITENLLYLDASNTTRGPNWCRTLTYENLPNLRILKLRGLRLTDSLLPPIVTTSRGQLWSLDLRNNRLTDKTIVTLLEKGCFLTDIPGFARSRHLVFEGNDVPFEGDSMETADQAYFNNPPHYHEGAADGLVPFRPDILGDVAALPRTGSTQIPVLERRTGAQDELVEITGLTHLYLSMNMLTARGVWHLLANTNRLQLLDVGMVRSTLVAPGTGVGTPDVFSQEYTTDVLKRDSCPRLEVLRIHHSIITMIPTVLHRSNVYNPYEASSAIQISHQATAAMKQQPNRTWEPLYPYENMNIRDLTLTGIPRRATQELFLALKRFLVQAAAVEVGVDRAVESTGRRRRAPELLSGLRKLCLEFLPEEHLVRPKQSVTGEVDAESYHNELASDFSFLNFEELHAPSVERREAVGVAPTVDVLGELKKFREMDDNRWYGKVQVFCP